MGLGSFPMLSDDDHSFTTTNSDDSITTHFIIKPEVASDSDYESDLLDGDKTLSHGRLVFSPEYKLKPDGELCFGCGDVIAERWLLKVNGRSWHVHCLRCCMCLSLLDRHQTCFIKDDHIYCKLDYARQFGTKCAKCLRSIQSNDWVRRAKDNVYHLACFACDSCKRQLSTGEEFALQDDQVLCKTHYVETIDGGANRDSDSQQRNKTKRVRTTFTEEQLQVLQANFQLDSNPDGQDLERIAQITGLSKRVTQVWFQNSRARQKKHQQQSSSGGKLDSSPQSIQTDDGVDWALLDETAG